MPARPTCRFFEVRTAKYFGKGDIEHLSDDCGCTGWYRTTVWNGQAPAWIEAWPASLGPIPRFGACVSVRVANGSPDGLLIYDVFVRLGVSRVWSVPLFVSSRMRNQ